MCFKIKSASLVSELYMAYAVYGNTRKLVCICGGMSQGFFLNIFKTNASETNFLRINRDSSSATAKAHKSFVIR